MGFRIVWVLAVLMMGALLASPVGARAAAGELDTSFGSGGKVEHDTGHGYSDARAAVVQPDGKVVVTGQATDGTQTGFGLTRYNADGSPDPSFGSGGDAYARIGSGAASPEALVRQVDGSLLVAGVARDGSGTQSFAVARFDPTGKLDTGFGNGGVRFVDFGSQARAYATSLALQPDGRIVVGGAVDPTVNGESGVAVVRLLAAGTLDSSFGTNGRTIVLPAAHQSFSAPKYGSHLKGLAVRSDGQIIATGDAIPDSNYDSGQKAAALLRLTPDGSVIPGGDSAGIAFIPFPGQSSQGASVVAGDGGDFFVGGSTDDGTGSKFAVAKYRSDGSLDTSYATGGVAVTPVGTSGYANITKLVLQPDGKLVASGDNYGAFALARYRSDGQLDPSFGTGGTLVTPTLGTDSSYTPARAVVLQDDGKLVQAGYAGAGHQELVRYLGDRVTTPASSLVSLGDSVAAGEGLEYHWHWDSTSPTDGRWRRKTTGDPTWSGGSDDPLQLCHRSGGAYGPLVAARLHVPLLHRACTGASAERGILRHEFHDLPNGRGGDTPAQLGTTLTGYEPPNQAYDNAKPDEVTLTLGANDVGFADLVARCYTGDCHDAATEQSVQEKLNAEKTALHRVLQEIHDRGSAAGRIPLVALTTYYDPFPPSYIRCADTYPTAFAGFVHFPLTADEMQFLRDKLHELNNNIRAEAANFPNVQVVDLQDAMVGHAWCSPDPWVYGPSIRAVTGEADNPAPFHPTQAGQVAIADRMAAVLTGSRQTPSGNNITVGLPGGTDISFQSLTGAGATTLTPLNGTEAPPHTSFAQDSAFDIKTSAAYSGPITLSIPSATQRDLFHYVDGSWHKVPSTYTDGKVVATVSSLSPFALGTFAPAVTADFSSSGPTQAPATTTFDASGSHVDAGEIASYDWDFGDGTRAQGVSTAHQYRASGTYAVTLRTTSDQGAESETTRSVRITNASPRAVPTVPTTAPVGASVVVGSDGSGDPNGSVAAVHWDFGDGSAGADSGTASHTYTAAGDYTVSLTVIDNEGAATTAASVIHVSSPPDPGPGRGGTPSGDGTPPPSGWTPPPPSGGGGQTPPPLALGGLTVAPRRIAVGRATVAVLRFSLSRIAGVGLTLTRVACAPPRRGRRRPPRCQRGRVKSAVIAGRSGMNSWRLASLFGSRTLIPGAYSVGVIASSGSVRSVTWTARFSIVGH